MITAILLTLAQFVPAFVALDLFFRYMPVDPAGMRAWLGRYALLYGLIGAVAAVATAVLQWQIAGLFGALCSAANWIPWWMLWRFGLRKQFTFLYKSDGGRHAGMEKPDP